MTAVILVAGLWPRKFHMENQAFLRADGRGLRFAGRGVAHSSSTLNHPRPDGSRTGSLTIEMVIEADREWNRSMPVILAIDDGQPCERILIGQWKSSLIIRSRRNACFQSDTYSEIGLREALPKGKEQFLAITSGPQGTVIYLNGAEAKRYPSYSILKPDEMLSERIVLGNSSNGKRPWTGTVSALAIYNQVLSSEEVMRGYASWSVSANLSAKDIILPVAHYSFDEKVGPIIKDYSGQGNDLIISEHFIPLRRPMLTAPSEDFQVTPAYIRDVTLNILGFIPFGLYMAWYLSERGVATPRVVILVLLLGAGASLFIEIVQAYLPERSSQLTDVLTNSGGTTLGIYLWYRYVLPHRHVNSEYEQTE